MSRQKSVGCPAVDSYSYSAHFLPFICAAAATKTETHSATVLTLHVNHTDFIFSKSATERYFLDEGDSSNYGWLKTIADALQAIDFAVLKNMLGKEPGTSRAVPGPQRAQSKPRSRT